MYTINRKPRRATTSPSRAKRSKPTSPMPRATRFLLPMRTSSLNQTFAENIRNNFSAKVKEAKEAGAFDAATFQSQLDAYMREYEFGVRRGGGGGGRTSDPVGSRAMELARTAVRNKIKEVGGNLKDYSAADITARAKKAVESNPRFRATAERQIEDEAGIDVGDLDSLPADGPATKAARKQA